MNSDKSPIDRLETRLLAQPTYESLHVPAVGSNGVGSQMAFASQIVQEIATDCLCCSAGLFRGTRLLQLLELGASFCQVWAASVQY